MLLSFDRVLDALRILQRCALVSPPTIDVPSRRHLGMTWKDSSSRRTQNIALAASVNGTRRGNILNGKPQRAYRWVTRRWSFLEVPPVWPLMIASKGYIGMFRLALAMLSLRSLWGEMVKIVHVRGHSVDPGSEGADYIARVGATRANVNDYDWDILREAVEKETRDFQSRRMTTTREEFQVLLEVCHPRHYDAERTYRICGRRKSWMSWRPTTSHRFLMMIQIVCNMGPES